MSHISGWLSGPLGRKNSPTIYIYMSRKIASRVTRKRVGSRVQFTSNKRDPSRIGERRKRERERLVVVRIEICTAATSVSSPKLTFPSTTLHPCHDPLSFKCTFTDIHTRCALDPLERMHLWFKEDSQIIARPVKYRNREPSVTVALQYNFNLNL